MKSIHNRALSPRSSTVWLLVAGGVLTGLLACQTSALPTPAAPPPATPEPLAPAPVASAPVASARTRVPSPLRVDTSASTPAPAASAPASVASGSTAAPTGPLTPTTRELQEVIVRQRLALRQTCWDPLLRDGTSKPRSERAEVRVSVGKGRVSRVEVSGASPAVAACVEREVLLWSIPASAPAGNHMFVLSFVGQA